jgi:hypothetical protein
MLLNFGISLGGVGEDVADDAHGRVRRVDVGVAHHVLFENVVLDGAGELLVRHALLLGGDDVEGHDGQHRAVHGHGHRHLIQRDAVEQDFMSSSESMATPALPTSPTTRGWSES